MANQLDLTMQHQEQCNWCWAAVATSIAQFLPPPPNARQWTQCSLASAQLNQLPDGCCTNGSDPKTCNVTSFLENSLSLVNHRSPQNPNPVHAIPDPVDIKQEIDGGRPIGVRIEWANSPGQGHFVLVSGYDDNGPEFVVMICDPEKPTGTIPSSYSLSQLRGGYQSSGIWTDTYFTG